MSKTHSGYFYIHQALKHNLIVANGKGDHAKVYGPAGRGYQVIPLKKTLAKGTECAIRKWFLKVGILLAALCLTLAVVL
jgi:hypothetical protein